MLNVIMLSVANTLIVLNVVMLNVDMLSVVAQPLTFVTVRACLILFHRFWQTFFLKKLSRERSDSGTAKFGQILQQKKLKRTKIIFKIYIFL